MEYKGYMVVPTLGGFPTFTIKAKGQGKVPKPLTGQFTSRGTAHGAIDGYLNSLLTGKKSNAKTKSSGTS